MASKNLSAIIQIGGTVSSSLRSSLTGTAGAIRKIGSALGELKTKQRVLGDAMKADIAATGGKNVQALTRDYEKLGVEIGKLSAKYKTLKGLQNQKDANLANRASLRGQILDAVALGASVAVPVKMSSDFEFDLAQIGVIGNLTKDELSGVRTQIELVSKDAIQSRDDVTKAFMSLLSAGLDVKQALAALPSIGKTSTAATASIEDMSKTTFTLLSQMNLSPDQLPKAFDMLAQAGKEGNFELKDMAQYLPEIGASAKSLGITGTRGVASLGAALQIARRGAGDASTAANNLQNFLTKLTNPETVKKFDKMGINLEQVFKKAIKEGKDPLVEMIFLVERLTNGDKFRIGELFGDMQVLQFLGPALADINDLMEIRAKTMKANGVVDADFARMAATSKKNIEGLTNSVVKLGTAFGDNLAPTVTRVVNGVTWMVEKVGALMNVCPPLTQVIVVTAAGLASLNAASIAVRYGLTFITGGLLNLRTGFMMVQGLFPILIAGLRGVTAAFMANPIGLILTGIAIAASLIYIYWEPISGFFGKLWTGIKVGAGYAWEYIKLFAKWSPIGMLLQWEPARKFFSATWNLIKVGAELTWGILKFFARWSPIGLIVSNWGPISRFFGGMWDGIKTGASALWDFMKLLWNWSPIGLIVNNWDKLKPYFVELCAAIKAPFVAVFDWIGEKIEWISSKIQWLGDTMHSLGVSAGIIDEAPVGNAVSSSAAVGAAIAGARANGGPVDSGSTYLVGERGPELFTPGRSGTIHPNGAGGGRGGDVNVNITVNAAQGQDARAIAEKVYRIIQDRMARAARGALYDEVSYA